MAKKPVKKKVVKKLGKAKEKKLIQPSTVSKYFKYAYTPIEETSIRDNVIPTGISAIDWGLLGIGGLPKGHFTEIYGLEKSGKTTLLLQLIASCQKIGLKNICVIDLKDSILTSRGIRAKRIGVDYSKIHVLKPNYIEELTSDVLKFVSAKENHNNSVILWDDMSLNPTKSIVEGKSSKIAEKEKWLWQIGRILAKPCSEANVPFIIFNHLQANIPKFAWTNAPAYKSSGGGGIKAIAKVRIKLSAGKQIIKTINKQKISIGKEIILDTEANAYYPPRRIYTVMKYSEGYKDLESTLCNAKYQNIVSLVKGAYKASYWPQGSKSKLPDDWTVEEKEALERTLWPCVTDPDYSPCFISSEVEDESDDDSEQEVTEETAFDNDECYLEG